PSKKISPVVAVSKVAIIFNKVLFPPPEGPVIVINSFSLTSIFIFFNISLVSTLYPTFCKLSIAIAHTSLFYFRKIITYKRFLNNYYALNNIFSNKNIQSHLPALNLYFQFNTILFFKYLFLNSQNVTLYPEGDKQCYHINNNESYNCC